MTNKANTVEDLLEILAGLVNGPKIEIDKSDATIMYSVARQVFKGIALTDRQLALAKEKLQSYKDQYVASEYDFDFAIDNLRMPLREIDRSKYIKIQNTLEVFDNVPYESYKSDWKWIKVRFPFSKKLILELEKISKDSDNYYHSKGSHEHFFVLNENNTVSVIDAFKNKSFDIEPELLEWYEKIQEMKTNKKNYVPGIYNYKLENLNDRAINYMLSSLGKPTVDNLSMYKDRSSKLGLEHFDEDALDDSINMLTTLSQKVVRRNNPHVLVNSKQFNTNNLCETLLELDRFPLLVVLPDTSPLEALHQIHSGLSGFIDSSESSVLFRLETHADYEFNSYVKQYNLNSSLDNPLKVVYINNNKVPKPLIKSGWQALTVLMMGSLRPSSNVKTYMDEADLIIHYDETASQMMKYQHRGIQEL